VLHHATTLIPTEGCFHSWSEESASADSLSVGMRNDSHNIVAM
jgi:hypothetical protein